MVESNYARDNQFAGLVEAATAAAGQEEGEWCPDNAGGQYDASLRDFHNGGESDILPRSSSPRKRKRGTDASMMDHYSGDQQEATQEMPPPSSPRDTHAGVHSAAVLFRAPSTSSKKYTRPPMSKLFASLQLLPEDFLHLQSAAKAYMLDDDHPERRECVGQRGKTDSDMVKLKLWKCVQEFLDREGNGERFFGANAPKAGPADGGRSLTWPENAQPIIKTCLPLLRRMVTNERQRQYAIESRKGGCKDKEEIELKKIPKKQVTRASVDESDKPPALSLDKTDIFGDELILDAPEISLWSDVYNPDGVHDGVFIKSALPQALFLPLVANIDGHCRLFHQEPARQCNASCQSRLVQRLIALPMYQQAAPAADPWETVSKIFDVVLGHLIRIRYWSDPQTKYPVSSSPARSRHPPRVSDADGPPAREKSRSASLEDVTAGDGNASNSPLQLLIYVVQDNKALLPWFNMLSTECPNIESLKSQVQKHHGVSKLQEKGISSLSEATLKVWLPGGLVRVEDDGQWMVALLSAHGVEWMGGQVRVLCEV